MFMKNFILMIGWCFISFTANSQKVPDYSTVKEIPLIAAGYTVLAEVYVSEKEMKTDDDKFYCWVKANIVHTTQGGYEGRLLHGKYSEFYSDNQIKQKGEFKNGMRTGEWKSWYPDGKLKEITHWKNGRLSGGLIRYAESGEIDLKGNFSKGKQDGKWITYDSTGNEIKISFKNGIEKKAKSKKEKSFKKRSLLGRKKKEIIPLTEEKKDSIVTIDSVNRTKNKKEKRKIEKKPKETKVEKADRKNKSEEKSKTKKSEGIKEPFDPFDKLRDRRLRDQKNKSFC